LKFFSVTLVDFSFEVVGYKWFCFDPTSALSW